MEATHHLKLRKACSRCRQSHVACDGSHPCQRCVTSGQADQCEFLPSRKRGRPLKSVVATDLSRQSGQTQSFRWETTTSTSTVQHAYNPPPPQPLQPQLFDHQPRLQQRAEVPPGSVLMPRMPVAEHHLVQLPVQQPTTALVHPHHAQERTVSRSSDKMSSDNRLLAMLLQQMQELRKENFQLRKSVNKMDSRFKKHKRYTRTLESDNKYLLLLLSERFQAQSLRERLALDPFMNRQQPRKGGDELVLAPNLLEIRQVLPFLEEYNLWPGCIAVDDVSKPFAAYVVEQMDVCDEWPIFVYASPSYCSMLGYELTELIGREIEPVCYKEDHVSCEAYVVHARLGPAKQQIGQAFTVEAIMVTKDSRLLYTQSRYQMFFTKLGRVKWVIQCIEGITRVEQLPNTDLTSGSTSRASTPSSDSLGSSSSSSTAYATPSSSSSYSSPLSRAESLSSSSTPYAEPIYVDYDWSQLAHVGDYSNQQLLSDVTSPAHELMDQGVSLEQWLIDASADKTF